MAERIPVAILGAAGSVGQRFVQLLDNHPWFEVVALAGSERTQGLSYAQACRWLLPEPMPAWARPMILQPLAPEHLPARIVFSALPTAQAIESEPEFARAGMVVCSNAAAFRRDPDVPLLLPEVNPEHIDMLRIQRQRRNWRGGILTNPNCTSAGLTITLKAVQKEFGLTRAVVVSLQALSGAGYPGVPSLDVIDNVLPYIDGEEEKVEWEPRKMLGEVEGETVALAEIQISAHSNRVAVSDGHLVCVSLELGEPAPLAAIHQALQAYQGPPISRNLPSTPHPVILLSDQPDRPQPRLDRMTGKGMTTVVGRLRADPILHVKFVVLSHNTIRGAAGGSIYNAELLVEKGLL